MSGSILFSATRRCLQPPHPWMFVFATESIARAMGWAMAGVFMALDVGVVAAGGGKRPSTAGIRCSIDVIAVIWKCNSANRKRA